MLRYLAGAGSAMLLILAGFFIWRIQRSPRRACRRRRRLPRRRPRKKTARRAPPAGAAARAARLRLRRRARRSAVSTAPTGTMTAGSSARSCSSAPEGLCAARHQPERIAQLRGMGGQEHRKVRPRRRQSRRRAQPPGICDHGAAPEGEAEAAELRLLMRAANEAVLRARALRRTPSLPRGCYGRRCGPGRMG
jgi:hypothetical protein